MIGIAVWCSQSEVVLLSIASKYRKNLDTKNKNKKYRKNLETKNKNKNI